MSFVGARVGNLFLAVALLTNVVLVFAALRWIGGSNFFRAMGSQVLTIPERRVPQRGVIAGVVAGLAYARSVPLGKARVIALVVWFLSAGFAAAHYCLLWRCLPATEIAPGDFEEKTGPRRAGGIVP